MGTESEKYFQELFDMSVDQDTLERLKSVIRAVVREEVERIKPSCCLNFNEQDRKDIDHAINVMKHVGGGHLNAGLEVVRSNHVWLKKQRETADKVSSAFLLVLIGTTTTGLLYALWQGIRHFVTGGGR